MPEKDGLELIKELKTEFPGLKTIAMSGSSYELEAAFAIGAHRTIIKPYDLEDINKLVKNLLAPTPVRRYRRPQF